MQHELGDGLDDILKWSKMAERYENTEINSSKNISEIKSTLNDLATCLERTKLRAVMPERKTVQFASSEPTKTYSKNTSQAVPVRIFDPTTGQRLNTTAVYDVTTGARLNDRVTSSHRLDDGSERQMEFRDRSPSPANQYNERPNTSQGYNNRNNRDILSQRDNESGGMNRNNTPQYNRGGYNRLYTPQRDGNQQYQARGQYNNRQGEQERQNYNNRGNYRGGPPRIGMQPYRGAPRDDQGGFKARQGTQRAITYPGYTENEPRNSGCRSGSNEVPCLPGQCWAASMTCYRCQNRGHLASRCTTRKDQPRA